MTNEHFEQLKLSLILAFRREARAQRIPLTELDMIELERRIDTARRQPKSDPDQLTYDLGNICTTLQFTNPIQLTGRHERDIINGAILALTIVKQRIDALQSDASTTETDIVQ